MPLRQAVFAFGTAEDTELVEVGATSLRELAKILKDKSGAYKAEIDPIRSVFLFHFYADRATSIFGPPWAILEQPRETTFNHDRGSKPRRYSIQKDSLKGDSSISVSVTKRPHVSAKETEQFGKQLV
jgi:hypothetical protein